MREKAKESEGLVMPAVTKTLQRVVLEHTVGPHKGLHQIVGTTEEFKGRETPTYLEDVTIRPGSRKASVSLIRSYPRYLHYRETDTTLPVRAR